MKKILALLLIAAAGILAWQYWPTSSKAPDVTFTTIKGEQIKLEDLRGKVVLVKFWATSCVTCIKQMPDNIEAYNEFHPKGFDLIAVAMQYDPANYVINYAETRKLPFTVAIDSQGKVARAFDDVKLTPMAFLIDKNGQIIKRYLGEYDKAAFRETLKKALAG
jgi:peroxiredoxin